MPIIGAGTWARNGNCAVSTTGTGEVFIRHAAAHEIASRIQWAGQHVLQAAQETLDILVNDGADGGLIAMDVMGNVAMPFSSSGMYRGVIDESMETVTAAYACKGESP